MRDRSHRLSVLILWTAISISAHGQTSTVTASVQVKQSHTHRAQTGNANIVVWLAPQNVQATPAPESAGKRFTLLQKDKNFEPHLLVIPVGSQVEFPNKDPFFHNVFSLFEGKRFDLGLYESGTTRSLRFDRAGISYLFCNIHSEMSAVIIALDTPYYATSDSEGNVAIPNVPAGRYILHVWKEGVSTEALKNLSRPVVVSGDNLSLGKMVLPASPTFPVAHKNKYGRDYEDPNPPGQIYEH
jgi:plastocyanin